MTRGAGFFLSALLGMALVAPLSIQAQEPANSVSPAVHFDAPVQLRGMLGNTQVEMTLQPKPDEQDSVKGTYRISAQTSGDAVLLAGEYTGSQLVMEESVNGQDVSGEWYGEIHGDTFAGTWSTLDDKFTKPFSLKIVRDQ